MGSELTHVRNVGRCDHASWGDVARPQLSRVLTCFCCCSCFYLGGAVIWLLCERASVGVGGWGGVLRGGFHSASRASMLQIQWVHGFRTSKGCIYKGIKGPPWLATPHLCRTLASW